MLNPKFLYQTQKGSQQKQKYKREGGFLFSLKLKQAKKNKTRALRKNLKKKTFITSKDKKGTSTTFAKKSSYYAPIEAG